MSVVNGRFANRPYEERVEKGMGPRLREDNEEREWGDFWYK